MHVQICTSEILRNKVVGYPSSKTSHDDADSTLENLGCVVNDEVHFISGSYWLLTHAAMYWLLTRTAVKSEFVSDEQRGMVWEEILMQLPSEVQMVALSATLSKPEQFASWIERVRGRTIRVKSVDERHVPLYFGGLVNTNLPFESGFEEVYSTHGPHAGKFDSVKFNQLFSYAIMGSEQHQQLPHQEGWAQQKPNLGCIIRSLQAQDKLPAIVFCTSRDECALLAREVHQAGLDLLQGEH